MRHLDKTERTNFVQSQPKQLPMYANCQQRIHREEKQRLNIIQSLKILFANYLYNVNLFKKIKFLNIYDFKMHDIVKEMFINSLPGHLQGVL
jgi:hypothetical protein